MNIEMLGTQHIKDAAALIAQSFANSEPLVSGLQIPFASFNKMCEEMVSQAASQSMSFVAMENFQMIGVILVRKANQPLIDKEKAAEVCPQIEPIFQLLDALEVNSIEFSQLDKENLVYLDMGACHPEWMGNGVVTTLLSHVVQEIVLKRNFDMVAACTNKISQQILKKRYTPFQINEIVYGDFLYQGMYPFSNITSTLSAQLLYIPQSQIVIKAI
ncbi:MULTISPECIES: hypothetical protein [unclassified Bacillus (in: firmicutes)]|uniref:GNAT family N-acetyltransferase n=1 Tax=Bacillus bruguierae TaxID=3127667 RepID=A0ABU8FG05_9BACI|nr:MULTISPECIES: hypothetical protein [unclassified Bacillus (in: firmicutes)]SFJ58793.1 hypothetical protein SAMN04488574_11827 [Bacillus sp. 71mf]SFS68656.1 hypothetical protein SAMN04488145_102483 [Bacillus sp. 103mf]